MNIEKINNSYISDVAQLHGKYIDQGLLSKLGVPFLRLLYHAMVGSSSAICVVLVNDGKTVGFASGAVNVSSFYKEYLKKKLIRTIIVLLPNLLKPQIITGIVETLFYPIKSKEDLPDAELLSIVVSNEFRGKGVGKRIFEGLVKEFRERHVKQFKVVVGSDLVDAKNFYEKMGGALHSEIEVHKGKKSLVYVWRI
jgi:ribosomal protein S18 acetylase RimI-like enzyme